MVAGFLLVTGIYGYKLLHRAGSVGGEKSKAVAVSTSGISSALAPSVQPSVAEPHLAVSKKTSQPEAAVQVVSAPGDQFQPVAEAQILDRRITTVSKDQKTRELLVKVGGKYPFHRIEETLLKNANADTYTIVGRTEMVADHVLVKLQDGKNTADLQAMLQSYGISILRELSLPGHFIVSLKAPTLDAVPEALSVFSAEAATLVYVEPDYISHISVVPNDSNWSDLWGMVKINATGAWDRTTGSTNVVVAVIDTGIDLTHPDLASNLWKNVSEANGASGVDDDGNGYIDDIDGWDFVNNDNNPTDDHGHGTHCSGTIGAVGNNSLGVAGVCWKVRLMPLKAADKLGNLADSDTAEAIHYASDKGAKVISASYGGTGASDTERDAIVYANHKGVLFVAAAGNYAANNDAVPFYPASYDIPNIVSVAATDQNDALASFSNYGQTSVDLAAPGVNIYSTVPDGKYDFMQGTSMATPHVAGAAALLLSFKPSLTPLQVKAALLNTADRLPVLSTKTVSGGRLNVKNMIALQDTDGDGMPDDWEVANGLNPNDPTDALLDPDYDHLNNLGEYENRCNPHNADTDGDTLWDGWEVTYGFSPNSPTGGLATATSLGWYNTSGEAKNIAVSGNYAYVADGANGLVILNIADPKSPVLAGSYDTAGTANDVAVSNGYAYVADGDNGLVIIDVSNPSTPAWVGWTNTAGTAEGVSVQSNYVYLADGANELVVFDVSNPALPRKVGNNYPLQRSMHDVYIQGNSMYVAAFANVYRMNTGTAPAANASAPGGFTGWNMTGVHGNGSVIAAVAGVNGVSIMDSDLRKLASYDTEGTASGVFVSGNYVYIADGTNGLVVLDISTPSAPKLSAHVQTAGTAVGVFVSGGYTYVTEGSSGIEIFSVLSDSDQDGLPDSWEIKWFGNLSQDGAGDYDHDGISNWGEYLAGLNPTNPDTDGDGLSDGDEVHIYNTDPRLADTDGDGLSDSLEVSLGTNPLLKDTDGDGMNDGWEVRYGFNPLIPDGSGDIDHDGLTDLEESQYGTNPRNPDTDGDGMPDGWEVKYGLNPLVNDAALDPDSDGLTNLQEYTLGTNPKNNDSDGDGIPDGWEVNHGLNPLVNDAALDPDNDGLSNKDEYTNNCDPHNSDTDGDGMPDGWEVKHGLSPTSAVGVNGASGDPDGDKLTNLQEYSLSSSTLWLGVYSSVTGAPSSFAFGMPGSTDPQKADSDGDGLNDYYEITTNAASGNLYITNPNNPDTDGDGFSDAWEVGHGFNPIVVENPVITDRDGDGLTDAQEIALGTQPYNPDDPVFVDDDAPGDLWPGDPQISDPLENGTKSHPYDSIQKAISTNKTVNGMTVLVADGTYWGEGNYNIDTHGKAITIKSWNNNPDATIINSLGYGPVFTLSSGETTNTVIKGLGITVTINDCSDGNCDYQHGVALNNASPRIENCKIYDCALNGIDCKTNSSPVIRDCIVSNVLNGIWCDGGSSPSIENCTIIAAGKPRNVGGDFGIGVYVNGSRDLYIGNSVVSNCNGRGISLKDSATSSIVGTTVIDNYGGMTFDNSSPRVERCVIRGNEAPNYYTDTNGYSWVAHKLFPGSDRNLDTTDEDENGGGILMLRGSSPFIVNSLIVSNRTWAEDPKYFMPKLVPDYGLGGGIFIGSNCAPTGVNCTVVGNFANTRGGGLSSYQSPFLRNMIFWENDGSDSRIVANTRVTGLDLRFRNLHCRSGSINIWYSDIQYGYPTDKLPPLCKNSDPGFVGGGNYRLSSSNSPCYNSATFYLAPTNDLDGNPRPVALPQRVDMGCYELQGLSGPLGGDVNNGASISGIPNTDPNDSASYFEVSRRSDGLGNVIFEWMSVTGRQYVVQTTTNLMTGWSFVAYVTGTGDTVSYTIPAPRDVARYYRVQLQPADIFRRASE